MPYRHDSRPRGGRVQALVFVGDAMEDLPTLTPASLACWYFCFRKGTDPEATRTFREIARLTGAPIADSIQAQPELGELLRSVALYKPTMPPKSPCPNSRPNRPASRKPAAIPPNNPPPNKPGRIAVWPMGGACWRCPH
jgi:hypothetical protein